MFIDKEIHKEIQIGISANDLICRLSSADIGILVTDYSFCSLDNKEENSYIFSPKKDFSLAYNSFAPQVKMLFETNPLTNNTDVHMSFSLVREVRFFMRCSIYILLFFELVDIFSLLCGAEFSPILYIICTGFIIFTLLLGRMGLIIFSNLLFKEILRSIDIK